MGFLDGFKNLGNLKNNPMFENDVKSMEEEEGMQEKIETPAPLKSFTPERKTEFSSALERRPSVLKKAEVKSGERRDERLPERMPESVSKVVPMPQRGEGLNNLIIFHPTKLTDDDILHRFMEKGNSLILVFDKVTTEVSQRIIDRLVGSMRAYDYSTDKLGDNIVILCSTKLSLYSSELPDFNIEDFHL